ncbi:MAG TPA: SAM-dependent chlorinase/fluorinase [bacterium]|nr:SAM-dependent chlorinase/fluorinase [bacterium]
MPAIVTLLSDFGSRSPYPAQMKAVLAASCDAVFIDITHDVPRHDIQTGAYLLATVAPTTPAGTVHLAVVDPGVGTARHPLIVTGGGQFFVGPDNGLLMPAAKRLGGPRVFHLDAQGIGREQVSPTFHGRDLFAPAAARLVAGTPPQRLGRPTTEFVDLDLGAAHKNGAGVVGHVIYADVFGNLITTIPSSTLAADGRPVQVTVGRKRSAATVERTYGDAAPGRVVIVPGSDGLLEVAVREGNAAERFAASQGTSVRIEALAKKQR